MYRTVKLFHGSGTMFALSFPFVVCVATTTLLLAVEGAQASFSPGEVKEAQKIVGQFLRDEAGTAWLSGLAKTNSAPLTTSDLMNAIVRTTTKGTRVWQAAVILVEALKSRAHDGTRMDSFAGQNDNWQDLIGNIEMEDDIICLYRKNTNETTRKTDDWKKFLKTVSPGYTVHLAIDTGRKYVICLKKIVVPEAHTLEERSTTIGTSVAGSTLSFPQTAVTDTTSPSSIVRDKLSTTSSIMGLKAAQKVKSTSGRGDSDESCDDEELGYTDEMTDNSDNDDEDIDEKNINDDDNFNYEHSIENGHGLKKLNNVMNNDLNTETERYSGVNSGSMNRPIGDRSNFSIKDDHPTSYLPTRISDKIQPTWDNGCRKPIIFLVPNVPSQTTATRLPIGFPVRNNFTPNLSWQTNNPNYYPVRRPSAFHYPVRTSGASRYPNNSPYLMKLKNLAKPNGGYDSPYLKQAIGQPIISQNNDFPRNNFSVRKPYFVRPLIQPTPAIPNQIRNVLREQLYKTLSHGTHNAPERPNDTGKYLKMNSSPRTMKEFPNQRIRYNPFLNSRVTSEFDRRGISARNGAPLHQLRNSHGSNQLSRLPQASKDRYRDRRIIKNPSDSRYRSREPIFRPQTSMAFQQPIGQPSFRPLIYDRSRSPQFPFGNQNSLIRPSSSWVQHRNQMEPKRAGMLEFGGKPHQFPCNHFPNHGPTVNYAARNNLGESPNIVNPRASAVNINWNNHPNHLNHSAIFPGSIGALLGCNNGPNHLTPPNLSDKPIKLQIIINGTIQEPLSVGVVTECGQKLEIVGEDNSATPSGSRAIANEITVRQESYDNEKSIQPEVDTRADLKEVEKKDASLSENVAVKNHELRDEKNVLTRNETITTDVKPRIESNEGPDIQHRLLHDTTIASSSSVGINETISTTINSTNVVQ